MLRQLSPWVEDNLLRQTLTDMQLGSLLVRRMLCSVGCELLVSCNSRRSVLYREQFLVFIWLKTMRRVFRDPHVCLYVYIVFLSTVSRRACPFVHRCQMYPLFWGASRTQFSRTRKGLQGAAANQANHETENKIKSMLYAVLSQTIQQVYISAVLPHTVALPWSPAMAQFKLYTVLVQCMK